MDKVYYEGKEYIRMNRHWTDANYVKVSNELERKLNLAFMENEDVSNYPGEELREMGMKLKESSPALAVRYFEGAIKRGVPAYAELASCYRMIGSPEKVIQIVSKLPNKNIGAALLTSAAAACLDMENYTAARNYASRAYAKTGGKGSPELSAVYARLKQLESGKD